MTGTRINHVSIKANDLEESARFYEEIFGMVRIPTARFPEPVLWLAIGGQQLHLFQVEGNDPTERHHFGIDVDDFDAVYARAKERSALDPGAWGPVLRRHPMGWVQLYLRDPAANLVEVNWPDASSLSPEVQAELEPLERIVPQDGEAATATLYHES